MSGSVEEWPEVNELVIGTVETITEYGAYIRLDEYGGKRGFVHVSEISSSWVRNVREHIKEDMKLVLRVLRVNPSKNQVDLSLRRVSDKEREEELYYWKRRVKGRSMLKLVADKIGKPYGELYANYGRRLEVHFGDLYEVFHRLSTRGPKLLTTIGIPEDLAKVFHEVASEKIKQKPVKVRGIVEITTYKPDGIEDIKEALMKAERLSDEEVSVEAYSIGAPRYTVEVSAGNYKKASSTLREAFEVIEKTLKSRGGFTSFKEEH